jgi:hypothetical protein
MQHLQPRAPGFARGFFVPFLALLLNDGIDVVQEHGDVAKNIAK